MAVPPAACVSRGLRRRRVSDPPIQDRAGHGSIARGGQGHTPGYLGVIALAQRCCRNRGGRTWTTETRQFACGDSGASRRARSHRRPSWSPSHTAACFTRSARATVVEPGSRLIRHIRALQIRRCDGVHAGRERSLCATTGAVQPDACRSAIRTLAQPVRCKRDTSVEDVCAPLPSRRIVTDQETSDGGTACAPVR